MPNKQSSVLITFAPIVFSLLIGGVGGYYVRSSRPPAPPPPSSASPAGEGGRGGRGGGRGGGQSLLPQFVRNLATLQKLQNKQLNAGQARQLLPILEPLVSIDKMTEEESASKVTAIQAVLTDAQKQAIERLQPPRPAVGMGGMMARGGDEGGTMGGEGGRPDPERPFASERNKQALGELIASLQHPQKS